MAGHEVCHEVSFATAEVDATADRETLVSRCREARQLYWRTLDAHDAERERIARQLHDDLAQKLTALSIELGLHHQRASVAQALPLIGKMVHDAIQAARQLENRLRPRWQEGATLNAAVAAVAQDFERRTGHSVTFRCSPHDIVLDRAKSLGLIRLLESALDHAVQHARATHLDIWLSADDSTVRLGIQDNGSGTVTFEPDSPASLALSGLKLQLERFHGTLQVMAIPADGTLVVIRLPLGTETSQAVRSVC